MAKILAFPVKKELPEEMKQRLNGIAKMYVKLMNDVFVDMTVDVTDDKEVTEITEMLLLEYLGAVEKAIEEMNESR